MILLIALGFIMEHRFNELDEKINTLLKDKK
jgi:hypothetical protein